jgi:hypothetical protein
MLTNKPDMMMHVCNPSYAEVVGRRITVQGWPEKKAQDPVYKITKAKRAGGVAQVVKCWCPQV